LSSARTTKCFPSLSTLARARERETPGCHITSPAFYHPSADNPERWGDYSAVTTDPLSSTNAWLVDEKVNPGGLLWGSRIVPSPGRASSRTRRGRSIGGLAEKPVTINRLLDESNSPADFG
jgi:hypothetical protein